MLRAPPAPPFVAIIAGLLSLLLARISGGLSPSLINPDEGGHYVNALFLGDWLRAGLPTPLAYARDYYAHFPRLTIGHWPPGWYLLEAPLFATLRPSPAQALALAVFVAGLPALAVAWALRGVGRAWLGTALAGAYLLLPTVAEAGRYILLDQPVALVVALAAMAWHAASARPTWPWLLLFAALAAAAPLVKGNGAAVALVPLFDIALTGRWALLRRPALWVAGLLALLVVAPWYWLSFGISAGGFNYAPGPAYAALALRFNAAALWAEVGGGGVALAVIGCVRAGGGGERRLARLSVAVIAAVLVFQSLIPAALDPRYLSPLLPWLVVLGGQGVVALTRSGRVGTLAGAVLAITALVPSALHLAALRPKADIGAPALVDVMARHGGIWLVDARAGGEGAVIAQAAWADGGRHRVWIARASQWLSASDFMGRGYRLTARTPAEARAVLDRLGAAGAVSIAERGRLAYPHSHVLNAALAERGYALYRSGFIVGNGTTLVAHRLIPVRPDTALIGSDAGSANAGKLSAALR